MNLLQLLELTYLQGGFTTRSDTARFNAELVAEASTKGYLSTETPRNGFQSMWRITPAGLMFLWEEVYDYGLVPPDATTMSEEYWDLLQRL